MHNFGPHLMLDFYSNSDRLSDIEFGKELLNELVEKLNMRKLCEPVVFWSECDNPNWTPKHATGFSGYVVIAESHISIHTFAESGYVFLDIFSCKEFDRDLVCTYLENKLGMYHADRHLVFRGQNFPGGE